MTSLPAAPDKNEAVIGRMIRDIGRQARVRRRIAARMNNLQLFSDIHDPEGRVCKRSSRGWSDTPDVQMLLERERRYVAMEHDCTLARESIEQADLDPKDRCDAFTTLAKYETLRTKELEAINLQLAAMRKDEGTHLATLTTMSTKLADLAQKWKMHEDRKGNTEDDLTDADLEE